MLNTLKNKFRQRCHLNSNIWSFDGWNFGVCECRIHWLNQYKRVVYFTPAHAHGTWPLTGTSSSSSRTSASTSLRFQPRSDNLSIAFHGPVLFPVVRTAAESAGDVAPFGRGARATPVERRERDCLVATAMLGTQHCHCVLTIIVTGEANRHGEACLVIDCDIDLE